MPTYQYACTACDHQLEAAQSFSDDPLTVCPECAGKLRKVFSAVGVVFKGSGFYRTDSRNGSNGSKGSNDSNDSNGSNGAKSEKSSSSSSDSSSSSSSSSNGSASSSSGASSSGSTDKAGAKA